jgi:hypothetical protein
MQPAMSELSCLLRQANLGALHPWNSFNIKGSKALREKRSARGLHLDDCTTCAKVSQKLSSFACPSKAQVRRALDMFADNTSNQPAVVRDAYFPGFR